MAKTPQATEDEAPLDPAVEAVRRRLARLLGVSISIMMIGLLAVLGAIVYRMKDSGGTVAANVTLALPAGFTAVDHATDGGQLSLRVRNAVGQERIIVYSLRDGQKISDWALESTR